MKNNNKKLKAQVQALNNQLKAKGIELPKENLRDTQVNSDLSKLIKKDLIKTFILISISFGLIIAVKILNPNLSLNKFF
jgi:hypothetical protein